MAVLAASKPLSVRRVLVALGIFLISVPSIQAQVTAADSAAIYKTVLAYIEQELPASKKAAIEPRSFVLGSWSNVQWRSQRSSATMSALVAGARTKSVRTLEEQATDCVGGAGSQSTKPYCYLRDVDVLIAIGEPVVRGSFATVLLSIWTNPVERNRNLGWVASEVLLERSGAQWRFSKIKLVASER
jgi:hypothetical protein